MKTCNEKLRDNLPDAIYNFVLFVWFRNYLHSYVEFGKDKKEKESESQNSDVSNSFRATENDT